MLKECFLCIWEKSDYVWGILQVSWLQILEGLPMIKVICFAHFILRVKDNNSHYLKFVICHPVTLEAVTYVIQIQSSICSRNYIICLSLECVSIELRLVDGRLGKPSQLSMRKKIVSLCCLFTGTPLHTMEHALLKVI